MRFIAVGMLICAVAMLTAGAKSVKAAREARTASGVTFTVNSTLDEPDALPGDGKCKSATSHKCTLRAAIMEGNVTTAGMPTIQLDAATYTLGITDPLDDSGQYGDLDILRSMHIVGRGADATIIDGNHNDRVFDLFAKAKIKRVKITHGASFENGGGIRVNIDAKLTLLNSSVTDNDAVNGSGIYADGNVIVKQSCICVNLCATLQGGGMYLGYGGYIWKTAVYGNCADQGGGFYVTDKADVGLVWNLVQSAVYNNQARLGAGIYSATDGTAFNSTIAYNSATRGSGGTGEGGGIYGDALSLKLYSTTISNNVAGKGGTGGGVFASPGSTAALKNTVLDLNTANSAADECQGTLNQLGYNIVYAPTNCNLSADVTSETGLHAGLGPLQNNGGPTLTEALTAGSEATDASKSCLDQNNQPLTEDQRGEPRPIDGDGDGKTRCDIGAFELQ